MSTEHVATGRRTPREKTRRGRPKGGGGDATRRKILDVALAHFAERGYSSATLSAIATEADIAPSALYHYFDGKEALYEAVYFDVAPRVWQRMGERLADVSTVRAAIETMMRGRGGEQSPHVSPFLAGMPTVAVLHPEFDHLLDARSKLQNDAFRTIAELGMTTGEFADFTVDEATEIVRTMTMGWFFERHFAGETFDSTIEAILKALDHMLRPPTDQ